MPHPMEQYNLTQLSTRDLDLTLNSRDLISQSNRFFLSSTIFLGSTLIAQSTWIDIYNITDITSLSPVPYQSATTLVLLQPRPHVHRAPLKIPKDLWRGYKSY